jgi:hypothetical protein
MHAVTTCERGSATDGVSDFQTLQAAVPGEDSVDHLCRSAVAECGPVDRRRHVDTTILQAYRSYVTDRVDGHSDLSTFQAGVRPFGEQAQTDSRFRGDHRCVLRVSFQEPSVQAVRADDHTSPNLSGLVFDLVLKLDRPVIGSLLPEHGHRTREESRSGHSGIRDQTRIETAS